MKKTVITAALAAALLSLSVSAATQPAAPVFTPEQEARIGEIAGDYLLSHPQILLEVSRKLQAQVEDRKAKLLTSSALKYQAQLLALKDIPVSGPDSAKVIVTEFFDYECVACSMMAPNLEQVMAANPGVRFAFRDWTIFAGKFEESTLASRRGLDIYHQKGAETYMAYHNGIYRTGHNEGKLTKADITSTAEAAGGGSEDHSRAGIYDSIIAGNDLLAQQLGLTGTPGIIVMPVEGASADNTTVIPGVVPPQILQAAIDKAARG